MTKKNNIKKIAIIGLGQIGIYLYNELLKKTKEIEIKTGKKVQIVAISAKIKIKKDVLVLIEKFFIQIP